MSSITIYHNPVCSKSRETLALIEQAGFEPEVIHYLQTPLSQKQLIALVAQLQVPVRELMRQQDSLYIDLNMADEKWQDNDLIECLASYPNLLNRPVVVTDSGARICRPPEMVLEILPAHP